MSAETILLIIGSVIVVITVAFVVLKFVIRRAPLKPRKKVYRKKWRKLQEFCKQKETWPQALLAADNLLDKALIKKGVKGKTKGERLANAQRKLSNNDAVWNARKLCKQLLEDPSKKLREREVKNALIAFGQALKDLGAL